MTLARCIGLALLVTSGLAASPQVTDLVPNDPSEDLYFGSSVALDDDYAYVGASGDRDSTGAVYVFDRSTGVQVSKITPPDAVEKGRFGATVVPWNGHLLVGCFYDDTKGPWTGSVYLLTVPDGALVHKFYGSKGKWGAFGLEIAADDDLIVVGAFQDSEDVYAKGAAFVFDARTFHPVAKLVASDGKSTDRFGKSVALGSDHIVVGAPERGGAKHRGRVYVFDRATLEELYFVHLGMAKDTWFGSEVAVAGDRFLASAPNSEPDGRGAVYVYETAMGVLLDVLAPTPSGADGQSDLFGSPLHVDGQLALIGAPRQTGQKEHSGLSILFHVPSGEQVLRYAPPTQPYEWPGAHWLDGGTAIIGASHYREVGGAWLVDLGEPMGESFCGPAVRNSSGSSASLRARGIPRVVGLPVTLIADRLPAGTVGYPLASRTQGFVPAPPGSMGNLCLGGVVGRLPARLASADAAGTMKIEVLGGEPFPPPLPPRPAAGETWNFQVWFRDQPRANFTNGLEVLFE